MIIKNSKKILFTVVLSVLVIGAFFYYSFESNLANHSKAVIQGSIVESVYGLGTVKAENIFKLRVGYTANISDVYVKEGQAIAKDQPLVRIGQDQIFKSPLDGVVTHVAFNKGETVAPNIDMLAVADLSERYILVALDQQGALRVKKGLKVVLSFESIRGQRFMGTVDSVYSYDGEFLVRIEVKELPDEILPDMTADVAIQINQKNEALLIPVKAVSNGRVFKIVNGKKQKIPVTLGLVDGAMAEVVEGDLKPGDQIYVK